MVIQKLGGCKGIELQLPAVNRDELEQQVNPRSSLQDLDEHPLDHEMPVSHLRYVDVGVRSTHSVRESNQLLDDVLVMGEERWVDASEIVDELKS
jgi:hypothetical protein